MEEDITPSDINPNNELREKEAEIINFMDKTYIDIYDKITQEELDEVIFIIRDYDTKIAPAIDKESCRNAYNYNNIVKELKIFIDKYGEKEFLVYLHLRGVICIISDKSIQKTGYFVRQKQDTWIGFINELDSVIEKNGNGIIYFNPNILKEANDIVYKKTKKLYTIQNELENKILELDNKIRNFNKDIISIVSIILAIVPIIAINANIIKDNISFKTILLINGCLILSITSIFYMIAFVIQQYKKKQLIYIIIPFCLSIGMVVTSVLIK